MDNRAARLKKAFERSGFSQTELCEKAGVTKGALSSYFSGRYAPKQKTLEALANALGVSVLYLMGLSDTEDQAGNIINVFPITTKKLPLLGEIACGVPKFANEDRESYIDVSTDLQADFCLKASGDSMINARIQDGDIVFIRQQEMVENGEIAAVVVNSDTEATLKRVYFYPEKSLLILKAENPSVTDLIFNDEELGSVHILGKAIAFQSDVI